jgi:signal transduction histidine kinase
VAAIDREIDRLTGALERLGKRAVIAERPRVDLRALVVDVALRHGPAAERAGVAIVLECAVASSLDGDAPALTRALDNLVQNALRHSDVGGTVTIAVRTRDGLAEIRVLDQGSGVHPEDRARILRPGERGRAPRGEGSGLGLPIARGIARRHGGELLLEDPPSGACFLLSLPLPGAASEREA